MNDELRDPELEAVLGRASGAYPDVNVAYETVRGRVRQAKRRRMMVVGTSACALLLAGTVIGVQAARDGADGTSVADTPTVVIETSRITSTSDDDSDGIEVVESTDDTGSTESTETSAPETSEPVTTEATTVATAPGTGPASTSGEGSSSTSGTTKPTLAVGADQKATSPGGTVIYSYTDGELRLIDVQPAEGWTVDEREAEDDRIRVEFTNASHSTTWRVEIRTEGGKAPIVTSEHG